MAAPNIRAVTTAIGTTDVLAVTNAALAITTNAAASGKVYKINSLYVANIHATNSGTITVDYYNGTAYKLINTYTVGINSNIIVIDKNAPIYLLENTSIRLTADANNVFEAVCSYETMT